MRSCTTLSLLPKSLLLLLPPPPLLLLLLLLPLLLLLRKHPIGTAAAADVDDVVLGRRGGVEVAWAPSLRVERGT